MWKLSWLWGTCRSLWLLILSLIAELFSMIGWFAQLNYYSVWIPFFGMLWIPWIFHYLILLIFLEMYDILVDMIVLFGIHFVLYIMLLCLNLKNSFSYGLACLLIWPLIALWLCIIFGMTSFWIRNLYLQNRCFEKSPARWRTLEISLKFLIVYMSKYWEKS